MKIFILSLLTFCTMSCVSTKYNIAKTQGTFDKIKAGTKYKFYDLQDRKSVITVSSVEKDSIIGTENKSRIAVSRNSISKIRKNNTAGTVILVGTAVGFVAVTAVIFTALRDIGSVFAPPQ